MIVADAIGNTVPAQGEVALNSLYLKNLPITPAGPSGNATFKFTVVIPATPATKSGATAPVAGFLSGSLSTGQPITFTDPLVNLTPRLTPGGGSTPPPGTGGTVELPPYCPACGTEKADYETAQARVDQLQANYDYMLQQGAPSEQMEGQSVLLQQAKSVRDAKLAAYQSCAARKCPEGTGAQTETPPVNPNLSSSTTGGTASGGITPRQIPPPPPLVDLHCPACEQEEADYKSAHARAAQAYDTYLRRDQEYRTLKLAAESDPGKWEGPQGQRSYVPSATEQALQQAGRSLNHSIDDLGSAEDALRQAFDAYSKCAAVKCKTGPGVAQSGDAPLAVTSTAVVYEGPITETQIPGPTTGGAGAPSSPGGQPTGPQGAGGQDPCVTRCQPEKAKVDQAAAELAKAEADLNLAERNLNRVEARVTAGGSPEAVPYAQKALKDANDAVQTAQAAVDAAKAKLTAAQSDYRACLEKLSHCPQQQNATNLQTPGTTPASGTSGASGGGATNAGGSSPVSSGKTKPFVCTLSVIPTTPTPVAGVTGMAGDIGITCEGGPGGAVTPAPFANFVFTIHGSSASAAGSGQPSDVQVADPGTINAIDVSRLTITLPGSAAGNSIVFGNVPVVPSGPNGTFNFRVTGVTVKGALDSNSESFSGSLSNGQPIQFVNPDFSSFFSTGAPSHELKYGAGYRVAETTSTSPGPAPPEGNLGGSLLQTEANLTISVPNAGPVRERRTLLRPGYGRYACQATVFGPPQLDTTSGQSSRGLSLIPVQQFKCLDVSNPKAGSTFISFEPYYRFSPKLSYDLRFSCDGGAHASGTSTALDLNCNLGSGSGGNGAGGSQRVFLVFPENYLLSNGTSPPGEIHVDLNLLSPSNSLPGPAYFDALGSMPPISYYYAPAPPNPAPITVFVPGAVAGPTNPIVGNSGGIAFGSWNLFSLPNVSGGPAGGSSTPPGAGGVSMLDLTKGGGAAGALANLISGADPASSAPGDDVPQKIILVIAAGAPPERRSPANGARLDADPSLPPRIPDSAGRLHPAAYHQGNDVAALAPGTLPRLARLDRRVSQPSAEVETDDPGGIRYSIVSNGKSSGEAFELRVLDPTGKLKRVAVPEGLVLEPVKRGAARPIPDHAPPGAKLHAVKLSGYCLEFAKQPPEEGMLYRVAPKAVQEQYRPVRGVLRAGREAAHAGKLHPDSEPNEYAEAIGQYALWARLGNWDEQKFGEMFLERSKKNAEAMNVKWTKQLDQAVRALVPGRWRDISMVLDDAQKWAARFARPAAK